MMRLCRFASAEFERASHQRIRCVNNHVGVIARHVEVIARIEHEVYESTTMALEDKLTARTLSIRDGSAIALGR
ncbi:hypothetical protein Mal15_49400 [Stieleria maiorica]|uniref:Uncharacterized protein n=1 Tax=Stieleria maiorica TaxID=2795974 RepID=A0A5B9MIW7_9BACT|nr:hypothetical protein Mal15_49400 [Stieleria maiorica]